MIILPDKILRLLSPEDRKKLGKAGLTKPEWESKWQARNERDLQKQIAQLLGLHGIAYCWHRTDRRSHATIGWPDFTFCVEGEYDCSSEGYNITPTYACAWEIKFGDGELSIEQKQMAVRLQSPPNNWRWRVIRSLDEAIEELKQMGSEEWKRNAVQ